MSNVTARAFDGRDGDSWAAVTHQSLSGLLIDSHASPVHVREMPLDWDLKSDGRGQIAQQILAMARDDACYEWFRLFIHGFEPVLQRLGHAHKMRPSPPWHASGYSAI